MDRRYRPYPQYKDSGIEWLGEIPAHWKPYRLKFGLARNDGGVWGEDVENENEGLIVLRSTEISLDGSWDLSNPARRKLSIQEFQKASLKAGDLLITKSSGSEQHLGKTAIVTKEIEDYQCAFSNFMQRLRVASGHSPKFLFYLLNCDVGKEQLGYWGSTTTGLRNLNATIFGEIYMPGAPGEEQKDIAAFLDRETARIDALIAKKRELIDLLRRQRTAVISHAVTKGLDPNVPLKDSGVEWLGEIPAHWGVRRLKFVASVTYSNVDKHAKEDEIPVRQCNYVDVYKNEHITNALEFMEVTAKPDEIRRFELQPGDIILTKDSEDWKDIAVPAFVSESLDNVICGYHLALVRSASPEVEANYLFRAFQAAAINYQLQVEATGITRYGLGKRALGDALVLLPPLPEQRAIAAYLDRETARIDRLIAEIEASIDLLQRQRTALISAAVTGKIDIRERQQLDEINALWGTPSRGG